MDGLDVRPAPTRRADGWLVPWRPAPEARLRLFCLPHAGAGAITYRRWAQRLAPGIEVVAVRLPGRETLFRQPAHTRVDELVPALIEALGPWLDRPYAWFGHSMGALVAFEACRAMAATGLPAPVRLLVSGRPAPHLASRYPPVHGAPTPEFVARLVEMGGTPPELLHDLTMLSSLLPTLRADLAVTETYRYRPRPPLDIPISVFGGADDPFATSDELHSWREHSSRGCTVRIVHGGHFFLHQTDPDILPMIATDLLGFTSTLEDRS